MSGFFFLEWIEKCQKNFGRFRAGKEDKDENNVGKELEGEEIQRIITCG